MAGVFPYPQDFLMTRVTSIVDCIGNTPLIRLKRLSEDSGCEILGKAAFMNPGGSVKERIAVSMIDAAEAQGLLRPGGI